MCLFILAVSVCRSVESPLALLPDSVALEEEVCDGQNWQDTVPPQLLATLSPREVDRQAVIYGMSENVDANYLLFNYKIYYTSSLLLISRAVHHRGVPPADPEGPGSGFFPEDEVCAEL